MSARAMVEAVATSRTGDVVVAVGRICIARIIFDDANGIIRRDHGGYLEKITDRLLPGESREAFALRIVGAK